jgi:hypothetical protein
MLSILETGDHPDLVRAGLFYAEGAPTVIKASGVTCPRSRREVPLDVWREVMEEYALRTWTLRSELPMEDSCGWMSRSYLTCLEHGPDRFEIVGDPTIDPR